VLADTGGSMPTPANGWNRRISPFAVGPGEGRLTEPMTDAQHGRWELVFVPRETSMSIARP